MSLKSFDIRNAALYVGNLSISSFADGEAVSFEFDEENFDAVKGTNGEVVRVAKNNNTATLKVRLNLGNDANSYFAELAESDRKNSSGVFAVSFQDFNGKAKIHAARAYFKKVPALAFGTEAAVREWEIVLVNPEVTESKLEVA